MIRCGDTVHERDGRHLGTVVLVTYNYVRVRWEGTGWKTDLPLADVVLYARANTTDKYSLKLHRQLGD